MAKGKLKVRCDVEGDYLEAMFDQKAGVFRGTATIR